MKISPVFWKICGLGFLSVLIGGVIIGITKEEQMVIKREAAIVTHDYYQPQWSEVKRATQAIKELPTLHVGEPPTPRREIHEMEIGEFGWTYPWAVRDSGRLRANYPVFTNSEGSHTLHISRGIHGWIVNHNIKPD